MAIFDVSNATILFMRLYYKIKHNPKIDILDNLRFRLRQGTTKVGCILIFSLVIVLSFRIMFYFILRIMFYFLYL